MKKLMSVSALVVAIMAGFVSQASAALDLVGVTFPITDVEAVAAILLVAAAGIWVIYKVMGLIKRG